MKLENGKYEIKRVDNLNVCLFKLCDVKNKKTGEVKQKYKNIGYYGNLKKALVGYMNDTTSTDCDLSAEEILDKIEMVKSEILRVEV